MSHIERQHIDYYSLEDRGWDGEECILPEGLSRAGCNRMSSRVSVRWTMLLDQRLTVMSVNIMNQEQSLLQVILGRFSSNMVSH